MTKSNVSQLVSSHVIDFHRIGETVCMFATTLYSQTTVNVRVC